MSTALRPYFLVTSKVIILASRDVSLLPIFNYIFVKFCINSFAFTFELRNAEIDLPNKTGYCVM